MTRGLLVLSLFPGVGLLDRAFEEQGFCVVRGPDLLWGGDIKRFNPPAGRFDGVIGGPPCQRFSPLANLVRHVYGEEKLAPNLIPEFERCVAEASPDWFLMENVPQAPAPEVLRYYVDQQLVADFWVGGETSRKRRFSFGTHQRYEGERRLRIEQTILDRTAPPLPAALASGGRWVPVKIGGSAKIKRTKIRDNKEQGGYIAGRKSKRFLLEHIHAQGLPEDFDLPGMTVAAKIKAIGNGVPLALGRALAMAVKEATRDDRRL